MTTSDYTYTIAQASYYPYSSFYPSLPADMTTEMSGWEGSGAVRKYAGWTTACRMATLLRSSWLAV